MYHAHISASTDTHIMYISSTHTHTHTHTQTYSHTFTHLHTHAHPHSLTHTHRVIPIEGSRISAALWGPFDEFLITGHEDGSICRYDVTRVRIRILYTNYFTHFKRVFMFSFNNYASTHTHTHHLLSLIFTSSPIIPSSLPPPPTHTHTPSPLSPPPSPPPHPPTHTQSGHCLQTVNEHKALISDLQASSDQIMIITASKDSTAKLMDAEKLDVLKTYRTERPVNSAAISPIKDHVSVM